jgi:hypothetical protein
LLRPDPARSGTDHTTAQPEMADPGEPRSAVDWHHLPGRQAAPAAKGKDSIGDGGRAARTQHEAIRGSHGHVLHHPAPSCTSPHPPLTPELSRGRAEEEPAAQKLPAPTTSRIRHHPLAAAGSKVGEDHQCPGPPPQLPHADDHHHERLPWPGGRSRTGLHGRTEI